MDIPFCGSQLYFLKLQHINKAELLWLQRGAWVPEAPASPGVLRLSLKVTSQVGFKCCLNAPYPCGHIISVFVLFSRKLNVASFTLSVTDPSQILLCKSFAVSGLRKMPGPTETNVSLACISSQPTSHTSTCWEAAVTDGPVSELKEHIN